MKASTWLGLAVIIAAIGCGKAPPPTGPAGEATTPEVEVVIPDANTTSSNTTSAVDAGNMTLVSFNVPGMSCPFGCVSTVKATLEEVPGVAKVDVDFDSKTAKCTIDPAKFDSQAALAKLTSHDQFKESTVASTN